MVRKAEMTREETTMRKRRKRRRSPKTPCRSSKRVSAHIHCTTRIQWLTRHPAECLKTAACAPLKRHYDECAERVQQQEEEHGKAEEDCVEECKRP